MKDDFYTPEWNFLLKKMQIFFETAVLIPMRRIITLLNV